MSTRSPLKARFGSRVLVEDVPRVASGSPARFLLSGKPRAINSPRAALVLAKRHMSLRNAHSAVTRLFDQGEVVVELPKVESEGVLIKELADCHVVARRYGAPQSIDVRAIREATGLSQED